MSASGSTRVSAEDRGEIIELYARYAWGLDLADPEMLLSAFAPDAEFDHLWQGKVKGHAAILENMQELWNKRQNWWFGRQHLFNHYIMEPQPKACGSLLLSDPAVQRRIRHELRVRHRHARGSCASNITGVGCSRPCFINAWRTQADVPWKGEIKMVGRPGGGAPMPPSLPPSFKARELSMQAPGPRR